MTKKCSKIRRGNDDSGDSANEGGRRRRAPAWVDQDDHELSVDIVAAMIEKNYEVRPAINMRRREFGV
jgi:hypothetical protein